MITSKFSTNIVERLLKYKKYRCLPNIILPLKPSTAC